MILFGELRKRVGVYLLLSVAVSDAFFSFEVQALGLIQFWQHNFKVQVEARSGIVRLHEIEDRQFLLSMP